MLYISQDARYISYNFEVTQLQKFMSIIGNIRYMTAFTKKSLIRTHIQFFNFKEIYIIQLVVELQFQKFGTSLLLNKYE